MTKSTTLAEKHQQAKEYARSKKIHLHDDMDFHLVEDAWLDGYAAAPDLESVKEEVRRRIAIADETLVVYTGAESVREIKKELQSLLTWLDSQTKPPAKF